MFYFNFQDLQVNCRDQIPAIFVLTVGLSLHYNNYRFNNRKHFRYECFPLLDPPLVLTKRGLIRKDRETGQIEMRYRTKDPQSYMQNSEVLKFNYPITKKVQYLKLLSYRTINDKNNWIPIDYVENIDKIRNNELLTIAENKIHFKYEGTN